MWARDQTFWRDVASRTASGLMLVLLGYVGALALGYLKLPNAVPLAGMVLVGAFGWYSLIRLVRGKPVDRLVDLWLWFICTVLVLALVIWGELSGWPYE